MITGDKNEVIAKENMKEYISIYADEIDQKERIPDHVIDLLKRERYLGSMISQMYGGMEMNRIQIGKLNCEIGQACSSTRSLLTVHGMVAIALEKWGSKEQKEEYLPAMAEGNLIGAFALSEPEAGSDAKSIECIAVKTQGGYILKGIKKWITMAQIADIFLVIAKLEEKPTAFLVHRDTPGFTIHNIKGLMGMRGAMIAELRLNNCMVSSGQMIGMPGMGISHIALNSLDYGRYTVAWGCVGICKACLEEVLLYSKKRKQFGVSISKHQLIQKMVTEIVVNSKAAELLCSHAAAVPVHEAIMDVWNAKYFASKAANLVSSNAVQIMGGNGCLSGAKVERFFRDSKIMEIIEGSSQIHETLIANNAYMKLK